MTKSELRNNYPQISATAVQERDGKNVILGNYCIIAPVEDGVWDTFVCNPKDMNAGLSTRKLLIILKKLRLIATFTELGGEAYTRDLIPADIQGNLKLLGIRKRRIISEVQRQRLAVQLGNALPSMEVP